MPRTRTRTTWEKGYCPNPGGRPKKDRTIEELAKEHTPAAIAALVAALKVPRERVAAAAELLNRAWGRPKQPITGDENAPLLVDFTWQPAMESPAAQAQPQSSAIDDGRVIELVWETEKNNE